MSLTLGNEITGSMSTDAVGSRCFVVAWADTKRKAVRITTFDCEFAASTFVDLLKQDATIKHLGCARVAKEMRVRTVVASANEQLGKYTDGGAVSCCKQS
jgi:hypothetical protein